MTKQEEEQAKIGKRIIDAREAKRITQTELAEKINLNRSVLNRIELGSRPTRDLELKSIANALDVSTDYLLGNTDKKHYYSLTEKDDKDIAQQAQDIIDGMDTDADVNFYGEPMTAEQKASMKEIIEMGLRINQEKAKKKFTPKKYRHGE